MTINELTINDNLFNLFINNKYKRNSLIMELLLFPRTITDNAINVIGG